MKYIFESFDNQFYAIFRPKSDILKVFKASPKIIILKLQKSPQFM